jgi:hypothetical protein
MSTEREIAGSAERLAALAMRALELMHSGVEAAQQVSVILASDVLELAELVPSEQREAASGAIARARRILGPDGSEKH